MIRSDPHGGTERKGQPATARALPHAGRRAAAPPGRPGSRRRLLRLLAVGAGIASLAAVASGLTFGFMSATTTGVANGFVAGRVVVTPGPGTSVVCDVTNLAPGDASTGYPSGPGVEDTTFPQCAYDVEYTGTVSGGAYLGLDVKVTSSTGTKLYDGTSSGLRLLIRGSNGTTYIGSGSGEGGTSYTTQGGTSFGTTLRSTATAPDLLVGTSPHTAGFTDEFTVDYNLPRTSSSNANIGGETAITLTFHAVQATHNTLPSTCTASGVSCTGLVWS